MRKSLRLAVVAFGVIVTSVGFSTFIIEIHNLCENVNVRVV